MEDYQLEGSDGRRTAYGNPRYYRRCAKLLQNVHRCVVYGAPRVRHVSRRHGVWTDGPLAPSHGAVASPRLQPTEPSLAPPPPSIPHIAGGPVPVGEAEQDGAGGDGHRGAQVPGGADPGPVRGDGGGQGALGDGGHALLQAPRAPLVLPLQGVEGAVVQDPGPGALLLQQRRGPAAARHPAGGGGGDGGGEPAARVLLRGDPGPRGGRGHVHAQGGDGGGHAAVDQANQAAEHGADLPPARGGARAVPRRVRALPVLQEPAGLHQPPHRHLGGDALPRAPHAHQGPQGAPPLGQGAPRRLPAPLQVHRPLVPRAGAYPRGGARLLHQGPLPLPRARRGGARHGACLRAYGCDGRSVCLLFTMLSTGSR